MLSHYWSLTQTENNCNYCLYVWLCICLMVNTYVCLCVRGQRYCFKWGNKQKYHQLQCNQECHGNVRKEAKVDRRKVTKAENTANEECLKWRSERTTCFVAGAGWLLIVTVLKSTLENYIFCGIPSRHGSPAFRFSVRAKDATRISGQIFACTYIGAYTVYKRTYAAHICVLGWYFPFISFVCI